VSLIDGNQVDKTSGVHPFCQFLKTRNI